MDENRTRTLSGLGVLRERPSFAWLWAGHVISRFGDSLDVIAFMWIILELTGSTLLMGTLVMVNVLPSIFLGPFAGVLVDRWSRKRVMIVADAGRGLITLGAAALWWLGHLPVWLLLVGTCLISTFEVFALPARRAVVPLVVGKENLVAANALYGFGESLASLFGLAAAGVVVSTAGILAAVLTDAVTFFLSAFTALVATIPEVVRERVPLRIGPFLRELAEGLHFVRSEQVVLFGIILAAVTNFALGPLNALLPVFVVEDMGLGPEHLASVYIGFTFGSLVGAALVAQAFKGIGETRLLRVGMVGTGLGYALLGLIPSIWATIAVGAGLGLMVPFAQSGFSALVQRYTPAERMGRVGALNSTLVLAALPLSAGLAGTVAEWVPIPWVFSALGLLTAAVSLVILWSGPFRALRWGETRGRVAAP